MDPSHHSRPQWSRGNSSRGPDCNRTPSMNYNCNLNPPTLSQRPDFTSQPTPILRWCSSARINNPLLHRRPPLLRHPRILRYPVVYTPSRPPRVMRDPPSESNNQNQGPTIVDDAVATTTPPSTVMKPLVDDSPSSSADQSNPTSQNSLTVDASSTGSGSNAASFTSVKIKQELILEQESHVENVQDLVVVETDEASDAVEITTKDDDVDQNILKESSAAAQSVVVREMESTEYSSTLEGVDCSLTVEGVDGLTTVENVDRSSAMEGGDRSLIVEGVDCSSTVEGVDNSTIMEGFDHAFTDDGDHIPIVMEDNTKPFHIKSEVLTTTTTAEGAPPPSTTTTTTTTTTATATTEDTGEKSVEDVEVIQKHQLKDVKTEFDANDVAQEKVDVKLEAATTADQLEAAAPKTEGKPSKTSETTSKETTGLLGSVMKTDLGEILRRSSRERKTNTRFIKDSIVPGMKLTDVKVHKTKQSPSPTDTGAARTNVIARKDPRLKNVTSTLDETATGVVYMGVSTNREPSHSYDQLKKDAIEGGRRLVIKARKTFPAENAVDSTDASTSSLDTVQVRSATYDTMGNLTGKMTLPKQRFTYSIHGKGVEKRQRKRFFKGSTYHLSLRRAQRRKTNVSLQDGEYDDDDNDDDDVSVVSSDTTASGVIINDYDVSMDAESGDTFLDDQEESCDGTTADSTFVSSGTNFSEDNTSSQANVSANPIQSESSGLEPTLGDERDLTSDEKMNDGSETDNVDVEQPVQVVQQSNTSAAGHLLELKSAVFENIMSPCASTQSGLKRKLSIVDTIVPNTIGGSCPSVKKISPPISKHSAFVQPLRIPVIHNGDIVKRVPTVSLHQSTPLLCTCRSTDGSHMTQEPTKGHFCQGIDCIDNRLIGCVNAVSLQELLRPAARVPFQALCEVHRQRLKLHQCCPGCGLFCSQGTFIQCRADPRKSIHHSHKDCLLIKDNKEICPHCGDGSNLQDVSLELNAPRPPSFFHKQQPVRKEPGARMAFTKGNELTQSSDAPESPTVRSYMIDQSGMEISSAGLPMGPDRSQLEGVLQNLSKQKPTNIRYTIKHMYGAAKTGEVEKILQMLVMGLDPNTKFEEQDNCTPLHLAAANGHLALVHVLVQASAFLDALDDTLQTPLIYAIESGQGKICEYLIKAGAQLEARAEDGMTALHLAAKAGQLEVVKQILDTGKVNINIQDDGGWTPLVWAAEHRHLVVVKYLLKRGSDPNIRDNERNIALHWSSFSGSLEISETFLNHGCDLNSANEHGDTPLHIAARQDKYECVMLLLARSADVDAQNKEGETPPMCCPDTTSQTWLALSMTKHLKKISVSRTLRTERILHQDISRGKEQSPIQCINGVDDESAPSDYLYIVENCETAPVNVERSISTLQSCRCEDDCTSPNCQCSTMSLKCWFDKDGKLVDNFNLFDPPMIFECNRACLCWATCHNRVLQRGITCRLQLFRTKGKGWGVRALKDIPRGSFICEYVGELISDLEADQREDDSYLFDLDNRDGETYCIDARRYGNISRFINHLCEPNLVPVKVFIEYQDLRFPRIALFSSRNIRAYEELGFDYGDKFWVIKYKMFTCTCASDKCKYSTKTIHSTLASYDKRLREEQEENVAAEH